MADNGLQPYNVTITNDSPTVSYTPYGDGDAKGGWNMTCSGSNDKTWIPHSFCVGDALRWTQSLGAGLSVDFFGTAA